MTTDGGVGFQVFCYIWGFASLMGTARSLNNQNTIIANQERMIRNNAEILRGLKIAIQKIAK